MVMKFLQLKMAIGIFISFFNPDLKHASSDLKLSHLSHTSVNLLKF